MAENYTDPSGNTAQFRAFVESPEAAAAAAEEAPSRLPLIAGIAVAVVVVALVAWLVLA